MNSRIDITARPISIKKLRAETPSYSWVARRCGMTYEYDGTHPTEPHKNVRVYVRRMLDASHVFVETSIDTMTYAEWKSRYAIEQGKSTCEC